MAKKQVEIVSTTKNEGENAFDEQVLRFGDLLVYTIMPSNLRDKEFAEFLPQRVVSEADPTINYWQFVRDAHAQRAHLREVEVDGNTELVIAEVNVIKKEVQNVFVISDLPKMTKAIANGRTVWAGGRSIKERLAIKIVVASDMGMGIWLTQAETILKAMIDKGLAEQRRQAREAEEAAREASRAEREARRATIVAAIMARIEMSAWTEKGQRVVGTPVIGDEWHSLADNTRVVLCKELNDEGRGVDPFEAFFVEKRGAKVGKRNLQTVTGNAPQKPGEKLLEIGEELLFELNNDLVGAREVASVEIMRELRANSRLNGGTLVAVPAKDAPGYHDLYAFVGKEVKSKGRAMRLTA